jgi:chemotaxis signal transduction protein
MSDESALIVNQDQAVARVIELRTAFDQSFAEPIGAAEQTGELILAVRAGTGQYVVRLSEINGIHECRTIIPLPGMKPACLGMVGLRGRLHAVFRLSALLGAAPGHTAPKWLLMTPGRDAPTLAVDSIDGCLAMKPENLRPIDQASGVDGHLRALFVREGQVRGLLHVPALIGLALGKPGMRHG